MMELTYKTNQRKWKQWATFSLMAFGMQFTDGCGTAQKEEPQLRTPNEVMMIAVGDIMMSRNVARRMQETKDVMWPVRNIAGELRKADIVFANLEGAICDGRPVKSGEMLFHDDPGSEAALQFAHVNLVSLANNHFPDFGKHCMAESLTRLDAAGIAHAGGGNDADAAAKPTVILRNGLRIALLAFNDDDTVVASYFAGKE